MHHAICMFERIFAVESLGYKIIYGASNNTRRFWDDTLVKDLGWEPKDNAEVFAEELSDPLVFAEAIEQGLMDYQGGVWLKAPLWRKK